MKNNLMHSADIPATNFRLFEYDIPENYFGISYKK